jgi:transketolase
VRDGRTRQAVQWTPAELAYLHDWNVVYVPDGFDWQQITAAQRLSLEFQNGQPTAIVYRTVKGWQYGIEGRASHGAGHGLCSSAFFAAVAPLLPKDLCRCHVAKATNSAAAVELMRPSSRMLLENTQHHSSVDGSRPSTVEALAAQLRTAQARLNERAREPSRMTARCLHIRSRKPLLMPQRRQT